MRFFSTILAEIEKESKLKNFDKNKKHIDNLRKTIRSELKATEKNKELNRLKKIKNEI